MRSPTITTARLYSVQTADGSSSSATPVEPSGGPKLYVPKTGRYRVQWACAAGAASGGITVYLNKNGTNVHTKGGLSNSVPWTLYSIDLYLRAGEGLRIMGQNTGGETTIYAERQIQLTPLS